MSSLGHSDQTVIVFIIYGGWLRMENKRDGKEALEDAPLASEISYLAPQGSEQYLDPFYLVNLSAGEVKQGGAAYLPVGPCDGTRILVSNPSSVCLIPDKYLQRIYAESAGGLLGGKEASKGGKLTFYAVSGRHARCVRCVGIC